MFWCDGQASESVLARYFDPKLGRFLTQDSFLGEIDTPPSLHRYLYANANPTAFIDPTGHVALRANTDSSAQEAPRPWEAYGESAARLRVLEATEKPSWGQVLQEKGKSFLRWAESFFVGEDGPSSGDPADTAETQVALNSLYDPAAQIAAEEERKRRVVEAGETLGKVGVVVGETALEIGAGDIGDFVAAGTGTTVTGEKLTPKQRAVAAVLAVVPIVAATHLRAGERLVGAADDLPATVVAPSRRLLPAARSAEGLRNLPGRAFARNLPAVGSGQRWLRGTGADAGRVPAQLADRLAGRTFDNFRHFREEFWREAAKDPILRRQFGRDSLREMTAGRAPFAPGSGRLGKRIKYELDHMIEIQGGGGVYDLNNLIIRTPVSHIGK